MDNFQDKIKEDFEKLWKHPAMVKCPYGKGDGLYSISSLAMTRRKEAAFEVYKHAILSSQEEINKLRSSQYVPGRFKCVKCKLTLVAQTLYMKSGTSGMNNDPQECSNGCGPMWRVTWEQYADSLSDTVLTITDRMLDAEEKLRGLNGHTSQKDA